MSQNFVLKPKTRNVFGAATEIVSSGSSNQLASSSRPRKTVEVLKSRIGKKNSLIYAEPFRPVVDRLSETEVAELFFGYKRYLISNLEDGDTLVKRNEALFLERNANPESVAIKAYTARWKVIRPIVEKLLAISTRLTWGSLGILLRDEFNELRVSTLTIVPRLQPVLYSKALWVGASSESMMAEIMNRTSILVHCSRLIHKFLFDEEYLPEDKRVGIIEKLDRPGDKVQLDLSAFPSIDNSKLMEVPLNYDNWVAMLNKMKDNEDMAFSYAITTMFVVDIKFVTSNVDYKQTEKRDQISKISLMVMAIYVMIRAQFVQEKPDLKKLNFAQFNPMYYQALNFLRKLARSFKISLGGGLQGNPKVSRDIFYDQESVEFTDDDLERFSKSWESNTPLFNAKMPEQQNSNVGVQKPTNNSTMATGNQPQRSGLTGWSGNLTNEFQQRNQRNTFGGNNTNQQEPSKTAMDQAVNLFNSIQFTPTGY